jgi:hypothetical protein
MKSFSEFLSESLKFNKALLGMPAVRSIITRSKVLTPEGLPRTVFHGTNSPRIFDKFRRSQGQVGSGVYFTDSPDRAADYAKALRMHNIDTPNARHVHGRTIPAYLHIENPLKLSDVEFSISDLKQGTTPKGILQLADITGISPKDFMKKSEGKEQTKTSRELSKRIKKKGFDGVSISRESSPTDWLAFDPSQIISAITGKSMK